MKFRGCITMQAHSGEGVTMGMLCDAVGLTTTSDCAAWAQAWGGWAQAIGAIAAIYVTARIAGATHKREEARRAADRVERATRVAVAAVTFAEQLLDVIRAMEMGCGAQTEDVINRSVNVLSEALVAARNIELVDLPQDAATAFARLRGIAAETLSATTIGSHISFVHRLSTLRALETRAVDQNAKLRQAVNVR